MLYAMTGVHAQSALPGCPGHTYEQRANLSDPHMSVSCAVHERHLAEVKDPLWAPTPAQVPLTEAEKQEAEAAKKATDSLDARQILALVAALTAGNLGNPLAAPGGQAPAVPAAPAPAAVPVPEAPAPAAGTPEPAKAAGKTRSRRTTAGTTA
jgi:hypothetical protein